MKPVIALALPLLCGLSLVHAENVVIRDVVSKEHCTLIKSDSCSSIKNDGVEVCEERHRQNALAEGGNTVVIKGTISSETRRPRVDGRYVIIEKTDMAADYYLCDDFVADDVVAEQENSSAPMRAMPVKSAVAPMVELSIEERLTTLEALNKKGLLTEEEYKAKRADILDDL
ncbi:MAG: SHOCT domain-containing protein [Thalassolituus sp.]|uniref:SHOCT domain-containing protein n=1 Tax=Thalassolituus sp. TaxID=2030822 RepID=UPI003981C589